MKIQDMPLVVGPLNKKTVGAFADLAGTGDSVGISWQIAVGPELNEIMELAPNARIQVNFPSWQSAMDALPEIANKIDGVNYDLERWEQSNNEWRDIGAASASMAGLLDDYGLRYSASLSHRLAQEPGATEEMARYAHRYRISAHALLKEDQAGFVAYVREQAAQARAGNGSVRVEALLSTVEGQPEPEAQVNVLRQLEDVIDGVAIYVKPSDAGSLERMQALVGLMRAEDGAGAGYCKIGFHTGSGGNRTGLGDYFQALDGAGRPAVVKSVDDYGPCEELAALARGSGVEHVTVFRLSGPSLDTPNYFTTPQKSAAAHWAATKERLAVKAPAFDRERVWLEVVNEPDKNRAAWLGSFAREITGLMLAEGYRVAMFGWAPGEPEPAHWLEPEMLEFLRLAGENPERVAVALHEYSLDGESAQSDYPYMVGRFQGLLGACDSAGIARPTVLVTEWGWTWDDLPEVEQAMADVRWAQGLYGRYAEVKGAALWYLGSGYGGIANKAQRLIAPVTAYALSDEVVPPEPGPPPEPPPPEPEPCQAKARVAYAREYWVLPQEATLAQFLAVAAEGYENRRTVGFSYDDAGIGCGLGSKKAVLFDIPEGEQETYRVWYGTFYPDTMVEFRTSGEAGPWPEPPAPAPGNAGMGLHASADPGDLSEVEFAEFRALKPDVIKVLSAHSGPSIARLAAENPGARFVVRAFLSFGGRNIRPEQFVNDTIDDVQRALAQLHEREVVVELHNEPNLYAEGVGSAWKDGSEFNTWFLETLALYRHELPDVAFLFPGLSPGTAVPGVRLNHIEFAQACRPAVLAADGLAAHLYWSDNYPMEQTLQVLDDYLARFPLVPVWVTEASNNSPWYVVEARAAEYRQFWQALQKRPLVEGVTFFVASASNPVFGNEVWIRQGVSLGIGAQLGKR